MMTFAVVFWVSFACVLYTYALYPLSLAMIAAVRGRPVRREAWFGPVTIVACAYNEAATIGGRVRELLMVLSRTRAGGEVIVVCDGSTDGTASAAREAAHNLPANVSCCVIELRENSGKASALTAGCAAATSEILVFADARQTWAADALHRLLENFADDEVGAVSGDLIVASGDGVMKGVGMYWRYEKQLRRLEGNVWAMVGVTGAISAVRRELFAPIPPGTILDDVYWPLVVAMRGFRVVHDERAQAFDRLPERARDEFRRKVRTLSGNLQLVARLPGSLLPWRNPIWFQLVSHKLLRLLVPWALLTMFASSAVISGKLFRIIFAAQMLGYLLAILGIWTDLGRRSRLISAAGSFLVLNAAAWVAFWTWISGNAARSWNKTHYQSLPGDAIEAMAQA